MRRQPLQAQHRPPPLIQVTLSRHGFGAVVLDVHLKVVLQILADTRQILHDVDADLVQQILIADAGHLQKLRRIDCSTTQDHLICADLVSAAVPVVLDADGFRALEKDATNIRAGAQFQVLAIKNGVKVRAGRGQTTPAINIRVERAETFLAVPVHIRRVVIARLLDRLEERLEQRRRCRAALHAQGAIVPTAGIVIGGPQRRFHALEVGEAVLPIPFL